MTGYEAAKQAMQESYAGFYCIEAKCMAAGSWEGFIESHSGRKRSVMEAIWLKGIVSVMFAPVRHRFPRSRMHEDSWADDSLRQFQNILSHAPALSHSPVHSKHSFALVSHFYISGIAPSLHQPYSRPSRSLLARLYLHASHLIPSAARSSTTSSEPPLSVTSAMAAF